MAAILQKTFLHSFTGMTVQAKNVGHVGHFRWLGLNVWWEISQIYIEYIKPIRQTSDEPWKFFTYTGMKLLCFDTNFIEVYLSFI